MLKNTTLLAMAIFIKTSAQSQAPITKEKREVLQAHCKPV
jgi:hypothetical protein